MQTITQHVSDKPYSIYLITNKVNGKKYVGQTCKTIENRWKKHVSDAMGVRKKRCDYLWNAIKKYGPNSFRLEKLRSAKSKEQANEFEKMWISMFWSDSKDYGYNLTKGGAGLLEPSLATRLKLRLGRLGKKQSDETKQRISKAKKGNIASFRYDLSNDEILNLYNSGLSTIKIGEKLGCDTATVWLRLKHMGVQCRPVGRYKGSA